MRRKKSMNIYRPRQEPNSADLVCQFSSSERKPAARKPADAIIVPSSAIITPQVLMEKESSVG